MRRHTFGKVARQLAVHASMFCSRLARAQLSRYTVSGRLGTAHLYGVEQSERPVCCAYQASHVRPTAKHWQSAPVRT